MEVRASPNCEVLHVKNVDRFNFRCRSCSAKIPNFAALVFVWFAGQFMLSWLSWTAAAWWANAGNAVPCVASIAAQTTVEEDSIRCE